MVFVATLCSLAVAGCSRPPAPRTIKVGEAEQGHTIDLAPGDTLLVQLPGNPSTGYAWTMAEGDSKVIQAAGHPRFTLERDLAGSPGVVEVRYTAVTTGSTRLRLAYRRPFEPNDAPARNFDIAVEVRPR
jgi:inhibitor of cysteine peptidase